MRLRTIKWKPSTTFEVMMSAMGNLNSQGATVMPAPWSGYYRHWIVRWDD